MSKFAGVTSLILGGLVIEWRPRLKKRAAMGVSEPYGPATGGENLQRGCYSESSFVAAMDSSLLLILGFSNNSNASKALQTIISGSCDEITNLPSSVFCDTLQEGVESWIFESIPIFVNLLDTMS